MANFKILTVNSCLFDNNSAFYGGAISNEGDGVNVKILDSEFRNNEAQFGGVIRNQGSIDVITNSTFTNNIAGGQGGVIQNDFCNVTCLGTIKEISNSTFEGNESVVGGAIFNSDGFIGTIVNSTFTNNMAETGNAIRNHDVINISFSTIANNLSLPLPPDSIFTMERGGLVTVGNGFTLMRNSVISDNSPDNCLGFPVDSGRNYSDDFTCGFTGDGSEIILNPLADWGGPTETMDLQGGDPIDGATVNCDALNEMGNPTGIPVGVDQRYFPRPFGVRCDSGAVEAMPGSVVIVTKVSQPPVVTGFEFESDGFDSLVGCGFTGDNGNFMLNDGDSIRCLVPVGDYRISEKVPTGYELFITCFGENENLIIDNGKGEIVFSVPEIEPSPDVDCLYTNVRKEGGAGGCTIAPAGVDKSIPLYLFIPVLILIRRVIKRSRG